MDTTTTETEPKTLETLRREYDEAKAEEERLNAELEPWAAALDAQLDDLRASYQQDNRELLNAQAKASVAFAAADKALRAAILAEYDARVKADPKAGKTLGHGCSVRVSEKLVYEDIAAVTWAETNAPYMIKRSVDEKAFKAAMESMDKMPAFVVVKETVTAVVKK